MLLDAYNTIARGRRYEQGVPLTISTSEVSNYLQLYDLPIDIDVFLDVVFMLDNDFVDEVREDLKKKRKPAK